MAADLKAKAEFKSSSDSEIIDEKEYSSPKSQLDDPDEYENINYPKPWKFEKFFIGGYNQGRMLKFKKPKAMCGHYVLRI
ncbi:MAG: hypothetical protein Q9214_003462 [Letrouitia sp. 1 TL-2023]